MDRPDLVRATLSDLNPDAVLYKGLDQALLGVACRFGADPVAAYDRAQIISVLMSRDGMTWEDAEDFFAFNILGVGKDHAPVIVDLLK